MKNTIKITVGALLVFSAGMLISQAILKSKNKTAKHPHFDENKKCNYLYLNPLRCEGSIISERTALARIEKDVKDLVNKKIRTGEAKDISVYYRDLHNGPIISINEDTLFTPASLLKVPIMLMYYKMAEVNPKILEAKTGKDYEPTAEMNVTDINQSIKAHTEYTIQELIDKMIKYSDNRSKQLLLLYLEEINPDFDLYLQTINDLGIITDPNKIDDFISVKTQASIYRVLYNAAYLNNEMSEKALKLLTQAEFSEGIAAGIPSHIPIAHKFGDRIGTNGEIQRHDCGIVYVPDNNYLICVMTRGWDANKLSNSIKEISKMIYTESVSN